MDRFDAMSLLVAVIDHGGFSAAGRALNVPVATISRKVANLEDRLGARLLIRSTRRLELTPAGADYLAAARRILEQVDEAERGAAGEFSEPRGELVVTAPIMFGRLHVLPIVGDFLAAHSEINVRLVLADRNLQLIDDHVDIALRIGSLPDSEMVAIPVGDMRTVTCASPALLARFDLPSKPEDLLGMPWIALETNALTLTEWHSTALDRHWMQGASPAQLTVTTAEAAVDAAVQGIGITRLFHYQVADALESGALQVVLAPFEPAAVPVSMVYASRGYMPVKLRRFLDFSGPRLRADLIRVKQLDGKGDG